MIAVLVLLSVPRKRCTRSIFSRVAQDRLKQRTLSNVKPIVCLLKRIVCQSRASCLIRTHHCWIFHLSLTHISVSSLLLPPRCDHPPPDPQTAGLSGRLATQSLLIGYEPNAIVETSSTEVTPIHRPSRRTCYCSIYNSIEDVASAPVSAEVDE